MKVKELIYNWYAGVFVQDNDGVYPGYEKVSVGKNGVVEIEEFPARGEGDLWSYTIKYDDGRTIRVFNPNKVEYEPEN